MISCSAVTNPAMTTMNEGMRISSGMKRRSAEIATLEPISTAVAASPMLRPFMALDVTAMVGHMPSTRTKIGFSAKRPLTIVLRGLLIYFASSFFRWFFQ